MPTEGQGARLLPPELETIRQHHQQTSNSSSLILAALLADRDALAAENARLRAALERAAVHLQIGVNRMRGCHAETGMHELLIESEEFVQEARAALTGRADGEGVQDG